MSTRLTNFYTVKRNVDSPCQKRVKRPSTTFDDPPKTRKAKIAEIKLSTEHTTLCRDIPFSSEDITSTLNKTEVTKNLNSSSDAKSKSRALKTPAYERFNHLAQIPTTSSASDVSCVTTVVSRPVENILLLPTTKNVTVDVLKPSISIAVSSNTKSLVDSNRSKYIEINEPDTETEPIGSENHLPLPFHMQLLFNFFRSCEMVVSVLHNRYEVCSFDKIKVAVQEIVRSTFSENTIGQFSAVYPNSYFFRYDKQLDKITKLPTDSYVLVLVPNLRTDGTQMGYDSPSKGHLVFTGNRLIQRRRRFYQALVDRVKKAHKEFLFSKFKIDDSELPSDSSLRRWHPAFRLDTAVAPVDPSPLPPKPNEMEGRITTASEAVAVFRARALFREALICEKLPPSDENTTSTILQPSPLKPLVPDSKETSKSLRGISESLLARVREREKQMQFSVLTRPQISEVQRLAYSCLPNTITQIWRELRGVDGKPVLLATVALRLVQSTSSGLSYESAVNRIEELVDLLPDWLEKLAWAKPHLRLKDPLRSVSEVIDEAKRTVTAKGLV